MEYAGRGTRRGHCCRARPSGEATKAAGLSHWTVPVVGLIRSARYGSPPDTTSARRVPIEVSPVTVSGAPGLVARDARDLPAAEDAAETPWLSLKNGSR